MKTKQGLDHHYKMKCKTTYVFHEESFWSEISETHVLLLGGRQLGQDRVEEVTRKLWRIAFATIAFFVLKKTINVDYSQCHTPKPVANHQNLKVLTFKKCFSMKGTMILFEENAIVANILNTFYVPKSLPRSNYLLKFIMNSPVLLWFLWSKVEKKQSVNNKCFLTAISLALS